MTSIAYVLLFLMVVYPGVLAFSYLKVLLFGVLIACVVVAMVRTGTLGLHPSIVLWTVSLSILSFVIALEGFFRGAPGAARMTQVYVVWPLIYVFIVGGVRTERIATGLCRTLIVSSIFIALYSAANLLIETNVLAPSRIFDSISFGWTYSAFAVHEGYIGMHFPGLNSMFFLLPFCFAALVTYHRAAVTMYSGCRLGLWGATILCFITTLVSGRRALYLVALTSPLLTLFFLTFQPRELRRLNRRVFLRVVTLSTMAVLLLIAALNVTYGVSLSGLSERFAVGFDFSPTSADQGTTERREQYKALLAGWMDDPILGAGHGMAAYGSIRSPESPWNYELYYVALLYQTGVIGFGAYLAGILWIYWKGIQVIKEGKYMSALMLPALVGLASILIASATNPYLARYDAMWVIFLPLSLINLWLVQRSQSPSMVKNHPDPTGLMSTSISGRTCNSQSVGAAELRTNR